MTTKSNQIVAVKIIKAAKSITERVLLFKTPGSVRQARREVNMLYDLRHQNIVTIRDHFEFRKKSVKDGLAIVMEYCSGGNLQQRLEELAADPERAHMTKESRMCWYKQLASALQFIHERDIAHRDLKPANILIDSEDRLKIADVGLAKTVYDELTSGGSYQEYMETAAGTRPYMAPEVFDEHYTISSDVFSMGLVMFAICELPQNLDPPIVVPIAKYGPYQDGLGIVLHNFGQVAHKSTSLLNVQHCPTDERELFDDMLQSSYHKRPTATDVVAKLQDIEERRRREQEQQLREELEAERRKREEQEQELEAERRRREHAERKLREKENEWSCNIS